VKSIRNFGNENTAKTDGSSFARVSGMARSLTVAEQGAVGFMVARPVPLGARPDQCPRTPAIACEGSHGGQFVVAPVSRHEGKWVNQACDYARRLAYSLLCFACLKHSRVSP